MKITIRGASDDLLEIEGDITEEFYPDTEGNVVAISDGTLLQLRYDENGLWRLAPLIYGSATYSKQEGSVSADSCDIVTLEGEIKWVALAKGWARP